MADGKRLALVTGGGSGIGLATVRLLVAQGWDAVGVDRNPDALAAARGEMPGVRFVEADVCDEAGMTRLVGEIGPIAGLVTCAGIARDVSFFDTTAELFRAIQEVNVTGTFICAKAAAASMRQSGGGAIVTIASVSGLTGNIGRTAYGASKGAVVNLTRVMAVELARYGIRVNGIAPGPIETPMVTAVHTPAIREQWHRTTPMARYGTPAEIAQGIAFLLDGERAAYITGQILSVDGGFISSGVLSN